MGQGLGLSLSLRNYRPSGPPPTPSAPVITSSSITGTPEDGETLTAIASVTGYPSPARTYQWQASGVDIDGEDGQTIVLNAATMGLTDGETISCEITVTNTEGSDSDEPTIAFVGEEVETPTAPELTQTSPTGTNPMAWESDYFDMASDETDYIRMRWRVDGGSWNYSTDHLFTNDDYFDSLDGTLIIPWPEYNAATFTTGELVEIQEGVLRSGVTVWSASISDTMADLIAPTAFDPASKHVAIGLLDSNRTAVLNYGGSGDVIVSGLTAKNVGAKVAFTVGTGAGAFGIGVGTTSGDFSTRKLFLHSGNYAEVNGSGVADYGLPTSNGSTIELELVANGSNRDVLVTKNGGSARTFATDSASPLYFYVWFNPDNPPPITISTFDQWGP